MYVSVLLAPTSISQFTPHLQGKLQAMDALTHLNELTALFPPSHFVDSWYSAPVTIAALYRTQEM